MICLTTSEVATVTSEAQLLTRIDAPVTPDTPGVFELRGRERRDGFPTGSWSFPIGGGCGDSGAGGDVRRPAGGGRAGRAEREPAAQALPGAGAPGEAVAGRGILDERAQPQWRGHREPAGGTCPEGPVLSVGARADGRDDASPPVAQAGGGAVPDHADVAGGRPAGRAV